MAKPVTVDGITYPSLSCAARQLNVPRTTLASRLKSSAKVVSLQKIVDTRVTLAGTTYSSVTAAARKLGLHPETLRSRLKNQWPDDKVTLTQSFKHAGKPLTVKGIRFPQVQVMLDHFNIEQTRYNEYIRLGLSPEEAVEVCQFKQSA